MYGLKKKWSGFVVILLTFFTILPAYAVPGVMIYNADQAAPTGFVRLVDDIAAPTQMIFMQVNPTATGFSYQLGTGLLDVAAGLPANTYIPSTAMKNLLTSSNGTTTWVVTGGTTGMNNSGNIADWLIDPIASGGYYALMMATGSGGPLSTTFFGAYSSATGATAHVRTYYSGFIADTTPNTFDLGSDISTTSMSTAFTSSMITLTGMNTGATLSIVGGLYLLNGSGSFTSGTITVYNGDTIVVQVTSSSSYGVTNTATLTIGGGTDTFSVSTLGGGGTTRTIPRDVCPGGDYSMTPYDGSCGTPPSPTDSGSMSSGGVSTGVISTGSVWTGIIPTSDLRIGKTIPNPSLWDSTFISMRSSGFYYIINYRNIGTAMVSGVSIIDTLPAGMSYAGSSVGPTMVSGSLVKWTMPYLTTNQSGSIRLYVTLLSTAGVVGGMIRNEATISGIVNDTMPSNNYTNIWVKYTGSTMMSGWIGSGMMGTGSRPVRSTDSGDYMGSGYIGSGSFMGSGPTMGVTHMMGNALGNSSSENTVVIPEVTTCPDAEIQSAYEFASYYALTSMGTCKSANMDGTLLRKHAAKMVVNFAIHALGKTVDTTRKCTFNDMGNEDAEMNWYATTACQLGIMGVNGDGVPANTFNPNESLDKAQLSTMISRLLYGEKNNDTVCWYCKHVDALYNAGIITKKDNLFDPLLRGWALVMFMRAAK